MTALIIILILAILLINWGSKHKKFLKQIVITNIVILAIYNIIGWWYVTTYLDEGGASLGLGLILMGATSAHFVLLFTFIIVTVLRNRNDKPN